MTQTPVLMNITYESDMKFIAENPAGLMIPVEPGTILGGSGKTPNPIDYLLASLGGCAGIKVLLDLKEAGARPGSVRVTISGTRREKPPAVFDKLHLTFYLTGELDDQVVADAIHETMTVMCPVAVMMGKAAKVTWEQKIGLREHAGG
jgi:putative redox protein